MPLVPNRSSRSMIGGAWLPFSLVSLAGVAVAQTKRSPTPAAPAPAATAAPGSTDACGHRLVRRPRRECESGPDVHVHGHVTWTQCRRESERLRGDRNGTALGRRCAESLTSNRQTSTLHRWAAAGCRQTDVLRPRLVLPRQAWGTSDHDRRAIEEEVLRDRCGQRPRQSEAAEQAASYRARRDVAICGAARPAGHQHSGGCTGAPLAASPRATHQKVRVLLLSSTQKVQKVTDYYCVPELKDDVNPFIHVGGIYMQIGSDDYRTKMQAAIAQMEPGIPVLSVARTTTTDSRGAGNSILVTNITNLSYEPAASDLFVIPADYEKSNKEVIPAERAGLPAHTTPAISAGRDHQPALRGARASLTARPSRPSASCCTPEPSSTVGGRACVNSPRVEPPVGSGFASADIRVSAHRWQALCALSACHRRSQQSVGQRSGLDQLPIDSGPGPQDPGSGGPAASAAASQPIPHAAFECLNAEQDANPIRSRTIDHGASRVQRLAIPSRSVSA